MRYGPYDPAVAAVPDLSVVVLTWNTRDRTLATLAAVPAGAAPCTHETVLVDNASDDGTAAAVRAAFPAVRVIESPRNVGFARGHALALPHLRGEVVVFLNSDAVPAPGALAALVAYLRRTPAAGLAVPPIADASGAPQKAGWRFPSARALLGLFTPLGWGPRRARRAAPAAAPVPADPAREADVVETASGACLAVRGDLLTRLGGFDVGFPFYFEDVDLCWRARRLGAEVHALARGPVVVHAGGASTVGVRGPLRLPLLQGMLRHMRRRLPPFRFAAFACAVKAGYVVRCVVAMLAASVAAVVHGVTGAPARAARAAAAAREPLWFLDHDLRALLRAWGGPAPFRPLPAPRGLRADGPRVRRRGGSVPDAGPVADGRARRGPAGLTDARG